MNVDMVLIFTTKVKIDDLFMPGPKVDRWGNDGDPQTPYIHSTTTNLR